VGSFFAPRRRRLGEGSIRATLPEEGAQGNPAVRAGIVLAGGPVIYARQAFEVIAALAHISMRLMRRNLQ
jgi:hypothetical protein